MFPPPREYIQFASDARRDRAEILIDIRLALLLMVNDRDKKEKSRKDLTGFASFLIGFVGKFSFRLRVELGTFTQT